MSVLYLMIPMALAIAGLFVWIFVRSVRRGQFDDLDTPPIRAVFDDDEAAAPRRAPPEAPAPDAAAAPHAEAGPENPPR